MTPFIAAGCECLRTSLDEVILSDLEVGEVCDRVADTLNELIEAGRIRLPEELLRTTDDGYARYLLHRGREYCVVVWPWRRRPESLPTAAPIRVPAIVAASLPRPLPNW